MIKRGSRGTDINWAAWYLKSFFFFSLFFIVAIMVKVTMVIVMETEAVKATRGGAYGDGDYKRGVGKQQ